MSDVYCFPALVAPAPQWRLPWGTFSRGYRALRFRRTLKNPRWAELSPVLLSGIAHSCSFFLTLDRNQPSPSYARKQLESWLITWYGAIVTAWIIMRCTSPIVQCGSSVVWYRWRFVDRSLLRGSHYFLIKRCITFVLSGSAKFKELRRSRSIN